MELGEIKCKMYDAIEVLEGEPDRTMEIAKKKRVALRGKDDINSVDNKLSKLIEEYGDLFYKHEHYFDEGFLCKVSIDYLPGLIKEKAGEIIGRIKELERSDVITGELA